MATQAQAVKKWPWWYLSFVGEDRWLGGCLVEATDIHDAVDIAWKAGCNPGGEVLGFQIDDDAPRPPELQYKLVSDEDEIVRLLGKIPNVSPKQNFHFHFRRGGNPAGQRLHQEHVDETKCGYVFRSALH